MLWIDADTDMCNGQAKLKAGEPLKVVEPKQEQTGVRQMPIHDDPRNKPTQPTLGWRAGAPART
jgi:hypothetical protein